MIFFEKLYYLNRHDRRGLLMLLTVAAAAFGLMFWVGPTEPTAPDATVQSEKAGAFTNSATEEESHQYYAQGERQAERFAFDPNSADSTQLLRLGLPSWMVRNIYKYRAAGGVYRTKEDFAQTYGLTAKQYKELAPYIHISDDYQLASTQVHRTQPAFERDTTYHRQEKLTQGETIDLNAGDTAIYKKVPGIGSYYARKINDYKNRLGGFVSIDQLDEIANLPQDVKTYFSIGTSEPLRLKINKLTADELRRHPYINYAQARAITDYRRLHGKIHSLHDLGLLDAFSPAAIRRLEPYINYD